MIHPASHRVNRLVRPKNDPVKMAIQHRVRRDAARQAVDDLTRTEQMHYYKDMPLLAALRDETRVTAARAHEAHVAALEELRVKQEAAGGGGISAARAAAAAGRLRDSIQGAGARARSRHSHHGLSGLAATQHRRRHDDQLRH